jgi:hypothetical protein
LTPVAVGAVAAAVDDIDVLDDEVVVVVDVGAPVTIDVGATPRFNL